MWWGIGGESTVQKKNCLKFGIIRLKFDKREVMIFYKELTGSHKSNIFIMADFILYKGPLRILNLWKYTIQYNLCIYETGGSVIVFNL